MNAFLADLQWRGLVYQATDPENFPQWLNQPRTVYCGFDPTAESLHVGSLLPLLMLRRFQKAGHRPVALVGGATGMIGDPSGKSQERNLLDLETLHRNIAGMERQMRRFLDFDSAERPAILVNNFDWMQKFSYLEFLRDVGKNFPVNVMLAKDSVKSRLGRDDVGISYTEFSYMLLQAYDFVHLNRTYGCELQIGGSDQWGNITAGVDLGRRMHGLSLQAMTCPLLTKSDGSKMGKTESGAIWLAADRTSPYTFYQYWKNVADDDVETCLKMLTELPREEIEALAAQRAAAPHERSSQTRLAQVLTEFVHGSEGLASAERATRILFGDEITQTTDRELQEIFADVPSSDQSREALSGPGLPLVDALCAVKLAASKSEARRVIEQGGAYVNNRRIEGVDTRLTTAHLASESYLVLRAGRKKYGVLRFR